MKLHLVPSVLTTHRQAKIPYLNAQIVMQVLIATNQVSQLCLENALMALFVLRNLQLLQEPHFVQKTTTVLLELLTLVQLVLILKWKGLQHLVNVLNVPLENIALLKMLILKIVRWDHIVLEEFLLLILL